MPGPSSTTIQRSPARVESNPMIMRGLSRCFLRRAEELVADGKHEIARGLVDEALGLDLMRAPSMIRFELQRLAKSLERMAHEPDGRPSQASGNADRTCASSKRREG